MGVSREHRWRGQYSFIYKAVSVFSGEPSDAFEMKRICDEALGAMIDRVKALCVTQDSCV